VDDSVEIKVKLRCFARFDGERWISRCPSLDLYSQGGTEEEATASLKEAVELWMESCLERETLPRALRELGWRPHPAGVAPPDADVIEITAPTGDGELFGDPFAIEVSIPAYQAALLIEAR
jgi:predicted RNase H-like HicB family nuclease